MTMRRAEQAGRLGEDMIAAILTVFGCAFDRQIVVGRTLYGRRWRVDFVLRNVREYPNGLILESKSQKRRGSVDEKFPYVLENIRRGSLPAIVVAHGRGIRDAADWLRGHCDPQHLVAVFDLEEFVSWLRDMTIE